MLFCVHLGRLEGPLVDSCTAPQRGGKRQEDEDTTRSKIKVKGLVMLRERQEGMLRVPLQPLLP